MRKAFYLLPFLFLCPPASPLREVLVEVHFSHPEARLRLRVGTTLHYNWAQAIKSAEVIKALKELKLKYVRLPTGVELGPSFGPAPGLMNVSNLVEASKFALKIGARPLICIRMQPAWELSPSSFGSYCHSLASALKREGIREVDFEILESPDLGSRSTEVPLIARYFSEARRAIKRALPKSEVGGPGLSAPWRDVVEEFLPRCGPLDFFSFHFFGTHNASTSSERLFQAAREGISADLPEQLTPGEVRASLISSGHPLAKVFITRLNVNSILNPDGSPRDPRVTSGFCSAWLSTFLPSASMDVECAIHLEALHPGWGLLRGEVKTPAYHALWLFSTFFPPGSMACRSEMEGKGFCFSARTKTAGNVLLVNTSDSPTAFTVAAIGMRRLQMCRARIYDAVRNSITYLPLPTRFMERLVLKPRSVAVVQFIPPKE